MRALFGALLATLALGCASSSNASAPFSGQFGADAGTTGTTGSGGSGDTTGSPGTPAQQCSQDSQCGLGKRCSGGTCVELPPEQKVDPSGVPPVASPHDVWAIAADSEVARITIATRAVDVATVPAGTAALVALPDVDAALALSGGSLAVTLIEDVANPRSQKVSAPYDRLTLSPDGLWAVAWRRTLTDSATGISTIAVVDVAALRAGSPAVFERAGGYRATDVVFRSVAGKATRVAIVAKDAVNVLALATIRTHALPLHAALPAEVAVDVTKRDAVATPDGRFVLVRVLDSANLSVVDVDAAAPAATTLTLPAAPTDLTVTPDGTLAVAVLRDAGQVAEIHLPADLANAAGVTLVSTGTLHVGQAVLSGGDAAAGFGPYALLFTTAEPAEQVTRLDLASGALTTYPLEKSVRGVAISPDGASAVVVHRPAQNPTETDPYEQQVDAQQGYSLVDIASGLATLQLTASVPPGTVVFAPAGGYAAVILGVGDPTSAVASASLASLVATTVPLDSPALFLGAIPAAPGDPSSGRGVFVAERHPAGRISFLTLDTLDLQTVTGFELNGQIGN